MTKTADSKIIGTVTTYHGSDHTYMRDGRVRIVAVFKDSLDPAVEAGRYVTDDEALVGAGGVTALDRVEVQPWMEKQGRFSWVTSDSKATDLDCFKTL